MKISQYSAGGAIVSGDKFVIARGGQNYSELGATLIGIAGEVHNAWIAPQLFATLQVPLTCPGNVPISPTSPAYVYIGAAWRELTAQPTTPTMANGTNWFNSGSAELATKEIDYFVYLGYNAIDGVVMGVSRIPYATKYSDFSTTSTNEKYCRIGNIAHASANDEYHVIGRFAATLSAGAGYTWSLPGFTPLNLIQHPIHETRQLSWAPVMTSQGGVPTSETVNNAKYLLRYSTMYVWLDVTITNKGTATGYVQHTIPFSSAFLSSGGGQDVTTGVAIAYYVGTNIAYILKYDATTEWVNNNRPVIAPVISIT